MELKLFGEAVLGVLFDQLRTEILRVKDDFETFKPKLEELEETLAVLYPVIEEIEELNRRLNRPYHGRETIILRRLLEDGAKLVSNCSKIPRWNFLKQGRYKEKLVELDNKILRFHNLYLQAHMGRDQKQTLLFVQQMRQMMIMSLEQQGFSNLTMGFTDSSDLITAPSTGSSNITLSLSTFGESNTCGSSCDAFVVRKQIIAIKVGVCCTRRKTNALKLAAAAQGVESVEFLNGGDGVIVTGHGVDHVRLIGSMREKVGHAELLSLHGGDDSGQEERVFCLKCLVFILLILGCGYFFYF